jgi:rubrerythrin
MDTSIEATESPMEKIRKFFHSTATEDHQEALEALANRMEEQSMRIQMLEHQNDEILKMAQGGTEAINKMSPELIDELKKCVTQDVTISATPGQDGPLPVLDPALIAGLQPPPVAAPQQ